MWTAAQQEHYDFWKWQYNLIIAVSRLHVTLRASDNLATPDLLHLRLRAVQVSKSCR